MRWRLGLSTWRGRRSSRRRRTRCVSKPRSSSVSTSRTKKTSKWQFWSWRSKEIREFRKNRRELKAPDMNANRVVDERMRKFRWKEIKMLRLRGSNSLWSKRSRLSKMLKSSNLIRGKLNLQGSRKELSKVVRRHRSRHTLRVWKSSTQMTWVLTRTELRTTSVWWLILREKKSNSWARSTRAECQL